MSNGTSETTASSPATAGSSWTDHPVAMAAAALAGAVLVGIVLYIASDFFDTGDEPPIVVKNGSIELKLLTATQSWVQDGTADKWKISSGTRGKEPFDITVAHTGGTCSSQTASGKIIRVTYSDLSYVDLEARNKKTKVTVGPNGKVLAPVGDKVITYGNAGVGYINGIIVDNVPLCAFTAASQLTHIVFLDN